jgi:hypothetical protein
MREGRSWAVCCSLEMQPPGSRGIEYCSDRVHIGQKAVEGNDLGVRFGISSIPTLRGGAGCDKHCTKGRNPIRSLGETRRGSFSKWQNRALDTIVAAPLCPMQSCQLQAEACIPV